MTKVLKATLTAAAAAACLLPTSSFASDLKAGDIEISRPWTRATPPGAKVAGGFLTLKNTGKDADRLIGGTFALSKRVEIHEMKVEDGIMRMKELADGLEIAPGASVELKPGSYHVMFMGLTGSPKVGTPVSGTLKFAKGGEVAVDFAVAPIGAKSIGGEAGKADGHGAMGHGAMDHGAMDHGAMDHGRMDHGAMKQKAHGMPSGKPSSEKGMQHDH